MSLDLIFFGQAYVKGIRAMRCPKCHFDNPADTRFCGNCAAPLLPSAEIPVSQTETLRTPIKELTTGSAFAGRYQIIEELGKGGMGKVYRVLDKKLNEEVALKLIKPEIASDKETIERFSNELKLARKIAHRNVGKMYELMEDAGTHYITMEYVPGENLKSSIRRFGPLPIGKTLFLAGQMCDGLAEAHRMGVVHRDLKPGNIMIDKDGNAKILDFGIARSLREKGITGGGIIIGTPEYMSPEQTEAKEVDQRSDIYSLGVILYEMATGRVPFEGDTALSVAIKHKTEAPKDPKSLNPNIPDDLSGVILKCLEKDKAKRYQTAAEVRSELEKIEKGIPTAERVVPERRTLTSREITVKFNLKKLLVPVLIFSFLVIAGVLLWRLIPARKATPAPSGKPSIAILYFKNSTGDKSFDVWRDGLSRMLISDLSQSEHIRVVPDDQIYSILSKLNALEKDNFSTEDLREIASRGGATYLLRGMITRSGNSFRIQATLQETKKLEEIAGNYSADGSGEGSFFSMIDDLTRKIKTGLNLSRSQISGEKDKGAEEITTSSPEAYKLCSEGYRLNYKGEFRKSIELLERAVAIDPQFASAYALLGAAYYNLGYPSKSSENRKKAFELSDRLPERERLGVQASYYRSAQRTYDKAIEARNQSLRLDPDDLNVARNLGFIYSALEQWDKALELYETNIINKVEAYFPYEQAALAYSSKGQYDKAQTVLEDYLASIGDLAVIHRSISTNYLCQGRYDLALREADKALSISPGQFQNFTLKGDIQLLQGYFLEAEKEYQKLFSSDEKVAQISGKDRLTTLYLSQGQYEMAEKQAKQGIELSRELDDKENESGFLTRLGYIYVKSGSPADAINEFDKALKIAMDKGSITSQVSALHLKGLALLEKESIPEAQSISDDLKRVIESWLNPKLMRSYYRLIGMIELKKKNYAEAVGHFEKAISLLDYERGPEADDHAFYYEPLAFAYHMSGNLEKAREQYEKITQLTTGRFSYGDIYVKSFYMLGKIHEQKGDKAKAVVNYQKFLDLWKDADPGLPEVEDATKRLAALKGPRIP